jgi:4-diphosphocytidyl-2-C-methyl-D-erythritol kinase
MITFPNAKINLGLSVVERRSDGYHNLETVFYPIPLCDALEVVPAAKGADSPCTFHSYGNAVEGSDADNLVVRAYRLLGERYALPPVDVSLYKHIPSGAGLGGGSSDATFMLRMLNEMFHLKLTPGQLEAVAVELGADCPFFVRDVPAYAEGIGERLTPLSLSLAGYRIAVVKPPVFVSTREAFAHITPRHPEHPVREIILRPISEWRDLLINDFEESIFPAHPLLADVKARLYTKGAAYAAMTGSGSSLFGIFPADKTFTKEGFEGMEVEELRVES